MSKPAHVIRAGHVRASVFLNEDAKNGPWYSVVLAREFKDGDRWRTAQSFGVANLLVVAEVCRQAWDWVVRASGKADPLVEVSE